MHIQGDILAVIFPGCGGCQPIIISHYYILIGGFGNILYLNRVRANVFYDFTKIYSRDKATTRDQRSVGAEIYIDTKWWNQYPLTFGLRVSRLLDRDQFDGFRGTILEFIVPVSIIPR